MNQTQQIDARFDKIENQFDTVIDDAFSSLANKMDRVQVDLGGQMNNMGRRFASKDEVEELKCQLEDAFARLEALEAEKA